MVQFFESVTDLVSDQITYLLTWEHILVISNLKEAKEQLFYARLAAAEGLSASALRASINENSYLKTPGIEKLNLTSFQHPQVITVENKAKNKPTIVETIIDTGHDREDNKLSLNIFENPYFPLVQRLKS